MYIPAFIRSIPSSVHQTCKGITTQGQSLHRHLTAYWKKKRDEYAQSALWQTYGQPFYRRNIQPLDRTDVALMGSSLILATLVTKVALTSIGMAAFSLTLGLDAFMIIGAFSISRYRVRKHFDRIAWGHFNLIRKTAYATTYKNQNFATIAQYRAFLQQPEFSHLDPKLKELDEAIRTFRSAVITKRKFAKNHLKDSKQAFINFLEGIQKNLSNTTLDDFSTPPPSSPLPKNLDPKHSEGTSNNAMDDENSIEAQVEESQTEETEEADETEDTGKSEEAEKTDEIEDTGESTEIEETDVSEDQQNIDEEPPKE